MASRDKNGKDPFRNRIFPESPDREFVFRCVAYDAKATYGEEIDPGTMVLEWNGVEFVVRYLVSGRGACHMKYAFGYSKFKDGYLDAYGRVCTYRSPEEILSAEIGLWDNILPRLTGADFREEAELLLESAGF